MEEKKCYYCRETQFLPSNPKAKGIAYSFCLSSWAPLGLPWNFDPTFYTHLSTYDTMPPKKNESRFGALEWFWPIFFNILRKFPNNYQGLPAAVAHRLGALPLAQGSKTELFL